MVKKLPMEKRWLRELARRKKVCETRLKIGRGLKQPWADPLHERKELMKFLEKNLNKLFFEQLPVVRADNITSERLRIFEFNGKKVVIKDTKYLGNPGWQGFDFNNLRKLFLEYQRAARRGAIKTNHHVLRSIKAFGTIGDRYLIIPFVQNLKNYFETSKNYLEILHNHPGMAVSALEFESFQKAGEELKRNIRKLGAHKVEPFSHLMDQQVAHALVAGRDKKGRWIFYLPYDLA